MFEYDEVLDDIKVEKFVKDPENDAESGAGQSKRKSVGQGSCVSNKRSKNTITAPDAIGEASVGGNDEDENEDPEEEDPEEEEPEDEEPSPSMATRYFNR